MRNVQCEHCQAVVSFTGARGRRVCDTDCPRCGRRLKAGIKARPTKGKRFGQCMVCGQKRLEGRTCAWHSLAAIAAAQAAKEREGGAA